MPRDPKVRAQMWQRISEFYWNFPRRCYKTYVKYLWATPPEQRDPARVEQAKGEFLAEMDIWEGILRDKGGSPHVLFGDSFSMLDVMAFPWIAFFVGLGLKLEPKYENLGAYFQFIKEWPSVKKFTPKRWDGSVDTTVLAHI